MSSLNAKGLCPIGARERHERSAESKNMVVKKNRNNLENKIEDGYSNTQKYELQHFDIRTSIHETNNVQNEFETRNTILANKKTIKQKTKIKPRSAKNKELVKAELLVFKKIWESRPHYCEVTGKPIYVFDVRCFSHVLTKGAYPKFRLYEKNIVFCLSEKHFEWEFCTRKTLELSWIETLESALKTEYYAKSNQP
jgi:hypothetical protein